MRILPILLLTSCILRMPDVADPSAGPVFDCEKVALEDGLGDPDPCDVRACESCVDACGSGCAVLESYPPRYTCGDEGSWDVHDSCPDWTFPEA